ncbi:von Willebrand factor type A domain-containing protein [Chitinophaga pendula]|uniref:YfbK domain-containing protein n=1 Tax=Chitinophaga TaxID=79328 RepID=UPI000BAF5949|nr:MULTISPECIES: von Willebrand factor type A domain-containing protein [Chitinophaga]ASZ14646.1 hypothetical protein CK934_28690 [Chitinophaga sp. MD30]UCJ07700.1 von Willebrand factor type A domain-containing protein [Chitinophaga pendula]
MQHLLILFVLLWASVGAHAQTVWVTGAVEDSISHQPLPGVEIHVAEDTTKTTTNRYGLFRIVVPAGSTHLLFTHQAYRPQKIALKHYDRMLVALSPLDKQVDEIAIAKAKAKARFSHSTNPNYGNTAMGMGVSNFFDETYGAIYENKFAATDRIPVSSFAVDVDRAAYSNIRRFMRLKERVPVDAVRIEEMMNYFHYDYPLPAGQQLMAIHSQVADCPWQPGHQLLQVAIRAKTVNIDSLPPSNLVFLIDVSGSMGTPNKLPLLQAAFRVLVNNLRAKDRVAIIAYAGSPGIILPCTPGNQKEKILNAIDYLSAGGATGGEAAIKMAYQIAEENFIPSGNNRVVMATDGDFNVGQSSDADMETLILQKKETGVLLTCLGVGMKDYKDSKLETLSSKGNGNFAYIDNLEEANKVFAREFGSTLFTIAKDVRAELTFNPNLVKEYRLIGYENKVLRTEDSNEKIIGGIVGAGHCAVAMYEIIPGSSAWQQDSLLAKVKLQYHDPRDTATYTLQKEVPASSTTFEAAGNDFRFASAVALLGLLLRRSAYKGKGECTLIIDIAKDAKGKDPGGYRQEFVKLVKELKKQGQIK